MIKLRKMVVIAASASILSLAMTSANAWWGPWNNNGWNNNGWGNNGWGNNGWGNNGWGNGNGALDGNFGFNMGGGGSGNGYGRGNNNYYGNGGYAPYGSGPPRYGYAPYGGGPAGTYGQPGMRPPPQQAPVPVAPQAPAGSQ